MATLESLFALLGDDDATTELQYNERRRKKVDEIAEYIGSFLKEPALAYGIAGAIMESAEEMGRMNGDEIEGEVPSRYTKTGNPLPFTA